MKESPLWSMMVLFLIGIAACYVFLMFYCLSSQERKDIYKELWEKLKRRFR